MQYIGIVARYYNHGEFRLERFVVPEGVERIGKYAFYGNRKLGEGAFRGCEKLKGLQ